MVPTRRAFVCGAGTVLLTGGAGCSGRNDDPASDAGTGSRQSFATPTPDSGMSNDRAVSDPDNPTVTLRTTHGDITVELFEERAPRTV